MWASAVYFWVKYNNKLNILGFLNVNSTKQAIWRPHLTLQKTVMDIHSQFFDISNIKRKIEYSRKIICRLINHENNHCSPRTTKVLFLTKYMTLHYNICYTIRWGSSPCTYVRMRVRDLKWWRWWGAEVAPRVIC